MGTSARSVAHPSLAVVKYWGKLPGGTNLPAVPSVAVTLAELATESKVTAVDDPAGTDTVIIDGAAQDPERFRPVFDEIRNHAESSARFSVSSHNTFPTAAGLASSSSGLAALVAGCFCATGKSEDEIPKHVLSSIARIGSGSAARAVFGGYTLWEAGAASAVQLHDETWWPDLRIVVIPIARRKKPISSREAMERTRHTSPYYGDWIADGPVLAAEAMRAIAARDIELLGRTARLSYLRMFATMFAADPPVLYWLPGSVEAQVRIGALRRKGVPAWETMDAGPQIKVITAEPHASKVADTLRDLAEGEILICSAGPGVTCSRGETPQ